MDIKQFVDRVLLSGHLSIPSTPPASAGTHTGAYKGHLHQPASVKPLAVVDAPPSPFAGQKKGTFRVNEILSN